MKIFFSKEHLELEAETNEEREILSGWNKILEKNGSDILTNYFDAIDEPNVISFYICENVQKEQKEFENQEPLMFSFFFEDFELPMKINLGSREEFSAKMEEEFFKHTKLFCDKILSLGGDVVSRLWVGNVVVVHLPEKESVQKVLEFIDENCMAIVLRKEEKEAKRKLKVV